MLRYVLSFLLFDFVVAQVQPGNDTSTLPAHLYQLHFEKLKTYDQYQCRKYNPSLATPCSFYAESVPCFDGSVDLHLCKFVIVDEPVIMSQNGTVVGRLDAGPLLTYFAYSVMQKRSVVNTTYTAIIDVPPTFRCDFVHSFRPIFSDNCLTPADACLDPSCPTYAFFAFGAVHLIPTSHFCVGSYYGYGTVYGTLCEQYAAEVSPYYMTNLPVASGFTDQAESVSRVVAELSCVYEYTKKPLNYITMFKYLDVGLDYLTHCSTIYFLGVNYELRSDGFHPIIVSYRSGFEAELTALREKFLYKKIVIVLGGPYCQLCRYYEFFKVLVNGFNNKQSYLYPYFESLAAVVNKYDADLGIDLFNKFSNCTYGENSSDPGSALVQMIPIYKHYMPNSKIHLFLYEFREDSTSVLPHVNFPVLAQTVDYFPVWGNKYFPTKGSPYSNLPLNLYDTGNSRGIKASIDSWLLAIPPAKLVFIWHTMGNGQLFNYSTIDFSPNYPPYHPIGTKHPQLSHDGVDYFSGYVPLRVEYGYEAPFNYRPERGLIKAGTFLPGAGSLNTTYYQYQENVGKNLYGIVAYHNSTTFAEILPTLQALGLTNFAIDDVQFNTFAPAHYRTLFKSRTKRSVNKLFYFVESDAVSTVVQCPGLIFISDIFLASIYQYEGAFKPHETSTLFWYHKSTFLCVAQNDSNYQLFPTGRRENCNITGAVNLNTLLPAELNDVNVLCGNGFVSVTSVDLCAEIIVEPAYEPIMLEVPVLDSLNTWPEKFIEIYTEWDYHYDYITLDPLCSTFTALPSCVEIICGRDANCYDALNKYEVVSVCNGLEGSIALYNELIDELRVLGSEISQLNDEFIATVNDEFGIPSSGTDTTVTRRKRVAIGSVALGVAVAATVLAVSALTFAGVNRAKIDEVSNDLNTFKTSTISKFGELQTKHNEFKTTTQDALAEQAVINAVVNVNQKQLETQQRDLSVLMDTRYKTHSQILQAHAASIASLTTDLFRNVKLFVNVHIAQSIVHTAAATALRLKDTYNKKISDTRRCLDSLMNDELAGCVKNAKHSRLLAVRVFNSSNTKSKAVGLFYASRQRVGGLTYRAATSFCDKNTTTNTTLLYIAAGGCEFVLNGTQVTHTLRYNVICPEAPSVSEVQECPAVSVKLSPNSRDAMLLNFTVAKPVIPEKVEPGLSAEQVINITTELLAQHNQTAEAIVQPIQNVDLTYFNETVEKLKSFTPVDLSKFDGPNTAGVPSSGYFGFFTFDRIVLFSVTFVYGFSIIMIVIIISNRDDKPKDLPTKVSVKTKYT